MAEASDRAAEIRAELADAEKVAKAELEAARQRHRDAEIAATDTYRSENYEVFAGLHRNYVGASSTYNGGVEIDITEYTINVASVSLNREETLALIEGLKKLVK